MKIKTIIKSLLGKSVVKWFYSLPHILWNYWCDFLLYVKHSTVFFESDTINKIESNLILNYHSIEKGLLFQKTKPRFAKDRVEKLHLYLKRDDVKANIHRSQIKVAYQVMCKYFELHQAMDSDISDYFSRDEYDSYNKLLNSEDMEGFEGVIAFNYEDFYANNEQNFLSFSASRKSIRNYTGELIPIEQIKNAIKLALNAPSVCNRQPSKVYLIENKKKIDELLKIQGGMTGYTENINQLLILTTDRNYFYSIGERNQLYIDGGIFLMNLLYSLHFYKIANCPANWGKTIKEEGKAFDLLSISKSEKIICFIPIGIAKNEVKVTLSHRREVDEVLFIE